MLTFKLQRKNFSLPQHKLSIVRNINSGKATTYVRKHPILPKNGMFPYTLLFFCYYCFSSLTPMYFHLSWADFFTPLKSTNLKFTLLGFSPFALHFSSFPSPSSTLPLQRGWACLRHYHSPRPLPIGTLDEQRCQMRGEDMHSEAEQDLLVNDFQQTVV